MNNTKNRIGKTLMGISLSLVVACSGGMLLTPPSAHAAAVSSSVADKIIATGKQFLGVPYQFGTQAGRTNAFDCSSFTQYVFGQNGINLPRSSRQQASVGKQVSKDQLQTGDLVFSDTNRDGVINHVSIYIGGGKLLHTYRVGIGVTISDFAGSTWDRTFVTARRVLPDNGQAAPAQPVDRNAQPADQNNQPMDTKDQPGYSQPDKKHKSTSSKPWKHSKHFKSQDRQDEN